MDAATKALVCWRLKRWRSQHMCTAVYEKIVLSVHGCSTGKTIYVACAPVSCAIPCSIKVGHIFHSRTKRGRAAVVKVLF